MSFRERCRRPDLYLLWVEQSDGGLGRIRRHHASRTERSGWRNERNSTGCVCAQSPLTLLIVLSLPDALRSELKEPTGPIYTDPQRMLEAAGTPIIAVGDVVTDHLLSVTVPHVACVDGLTKRTALDESVDLSPFDRRIDVENPAATLSEELLKALPAALDTDDTTVIVVDGEEDLAAVPAIVTAPLGASVVYGQPDEGMVLAAVDKELTAEMRDLLSRMDGDHETALAILDGRET